MKKFAVILAGCGVFDGTEIHEAVLTMLAIDKLGATYECFAPDISQAHVINHVNGKVSPETRNVLEESARIARGAIKPLEAYDPLHFDGLIFPGGFGCAKNLCDWAFKGDNCTVDARVERAVLETWKLAKPIGAMCIAPVILAKLFDGNKLTTGQDPASRKYIEAQGNEYIPTTHGEVIIDPGKKLFTTPCYMLDARISEIATGTENIVREMMKAM